MTKLIILLCTVVYVAADIRDKDPNFELFKYDPNDVYTLPEDIDEEKPATIYTGDEMKAKVERLENLSGNKKFKLDLKTQNGIELSSVGKLKDDKTFVVSGSYAFTGANGKRYRTRYTADEFGYHPITELELDLPEIEPVSANLKSSNKKSGADEKKNRFQFLKQDFNLDAGPSPVGINSESDNIYNYNDHYPHDCQSHGYVYQPPSEPFSMPVPSHS